MMTYTEQQLALAKWEGWKERTIYCPKCKIEMDNDSDEVYCEVGPMFHKKCGFTCEFHGEVDMPDYNSLDVLHECEGKIIGTEIEQRWKMQIISVVMKCSLSVVWNGPITICIAGQVAHATAAQRREALLRTLSLWQDDLKPNPAH